MNAVRLQAFHRALDVKDFLRLTQMPTSAIVTRLAEIGLPILVQFLQYADQDWYSSYNGLTGTQNLLHALHNTE
jgi:hypothetical protein